MPLSEKDKQAIFDKILHIIDKKYVSSGALNPDTAKLRADHERAVLTTKTAEEFEHEVNRMLRDLGPGHTGFFHEAAPRAAPRIALAATFAKVPTSDGPRWMFQDVHPGGTAANAGILPGDVLLQVDAKEMVPPEAAPFMLGRSHTISVRRPNGETVTKTLEIPSSREKKRPIVVPDRVVTALKLEPDIGLIRVSMFPGVLGMDVARDISRAVAELSCRKLIFDLRGNTGGGIGCLRLMSHLCSDRRGVGYSLDRAALRKGTTKDRLPQFDRIPGSKFAVLPLIVRFGLAGRSIAVFTEALGAGSHQGRVVLLVNEHSASAAEMVAAFASEYQLATLVGVKTAGRLVASGVMKLDSGYRIALPIAAYRTWQERSVEGSGVQPNIEEVLSPEALWIGRDNQRDRAMRVCRDI